ncbi:MAG: 3-isopropylmalate dehydratase small subunit [Acidobacteria bacterium]|nr:3-isopropylmalate dehydratase small subunit [Acidobacteriota bacterium]
MKPFTTLTGTAAPLLRANVDTDLIIPKQFLKTLVRTGLGRHLFSEIRYDAEGRELPEFILNQPAFRGAEVLLSGPNFGCGSSREHAPWALLDFGIRCVIAPSFAEIFFNNCFANGILPLALPMAAIQQLAEAKGPVTVDLPEQTVSAAGLCFRFELEPARKNTLVQGLDEIARSLACLPAIEDYEAQRARATPWL